MLAQLTNLVGKCGKTISPHQRMTANGPFDVKAVDAIIS